MRQEHGGMKSEMFRTANRAGLEDVAALFNRQSPGKQVYFVEPVG